MKRTHAALVLLASGVAVGLVLQWGLRSRRPVVTVTVRNESRKPVAAARVVHVGGVEVLGDLACGDSRTVRFFAPGETSYRLEVDFGDGTRAAGRTQYAEPGYRFSETITDSSVETHPKPHGVY